MEQKAEFKSEYLNGVMLALAGNYKEHNTISVNISGVLGNQLLDKPCRGYHSDLRVKITATGLYTYPDIIIEILSPSTEDYDRGTKFKHYCETDSLKEYVLVSQTEIGIENGYHKFLIAIRITQVLKAGNLHFKFFSLLLKPYFRGKLF